MPLVVLDTYSAFLSDRLFPERSSESICSAGRERGRVKRKWWCRRERSGTSASNVLQERFDKGGLGLIPEAVRQQPESPRERPQRLIMDSVSQWGRTLGALESYHHVFGKNQRKEEGGDGRRGGGWRIREEKCVFEASGDEFVRTVGLWPRRSVSGQRIIQEKTTTSGLLHWSSRGEHSQHIQAVTQPGSLSWTTDGGHETWWRAPPERAEKRQFEFRLYSQTL